MRAIVTEDNPSTTPVQGLAIFLSHGLAGWMRVWFSLARHLNPFLTSQVWAPQGVDLTWTTSIPAVGLLAAPLTLTLGPVER
jgi:hypothetical protein